MRFDNSFFFGSNYLNLKKNKTYLKYLFRCKDSADNLYSEFKNNSNEILNSFTRFYQNKVEFLKKKKLSVKIKKQ